MIPSQLHVCSLVSLSNSISSKYASIFVCLVLNFMRKQRMIKRKYLLIYFILICNFILANNNQMYLALDCSMLKKNLVDFSPSSYQLHLLLICIPFAFSSCIASSCCLQTGIYVINIVFIIFFKMLEFCF